VQRSRALNCSQQAEERKEEKCKIGEARTGRVRKRKTQDQMDMRKRAAVEQKTELVKGSGNVKQRGEYKTAETAGQGEEGYHTPCPHERDGVARDDDTPAVDAHS
jgi:hypothetical protein